MKINLKIAARVYPEWFSADPQKNKFAYVLRCHVIEDDSVCHPPHGYHGVWFRWDENAQLQSVTHYKNGKKHGKCKLFDGHGDHIFSLIYVEGVQSGFSIPSPLHH